MEKTILKSFKTYKLLPFNLEAVLNRFKVKDTKRLSLSDSTTLVLSALDWRKIKKLLYKVVEDIY